MGNYSQQVWGNICMNGKTENICKKSLLPNLLKLTIDCCSFLLIYKFEYANRYSTYA